MQVKIDMPDPDALNNGMNKDLEKGVFRAFVDLIKMDDKIIWDPVGAFFCLSGGYRIQRNGMDAGVYDIYDQKFFLTNEHINKLFAIAERRKANRSRGFLGLFVKYGK